MRSKYNRTGRSLPKTHWIDAACVGESTAAKLISPAIVLEIKAKGRGNRQMGMANFGFRISDLNSQSEIRNSKSEAPSQSPECEGRSYAPRCLINQALDRSTQLPRSGHSPASCWLQGEAVSSPLTAQEVPGRGKVFRLLMTLQRTLAESYIGAAFLSCATIRLACSIMLSENPKPSSQNVWGCLRHQVNCRLA